MNDLGLDSLDHVEIIVAVENEFLIISIFIFHSQVSKFRMLIMINYIQYKQLLII